MPPILTERQSWKKPRPPNETRRASDLTPEEYANVRRALRFLRTRLGGSVKLAAALKANVRTVDKACHARGKPGAALAIRAARAAGVTVEDVLLGAWPPPKMCPFCGGSGSI
jgi:hypothetical protein